MALKIISIEQTTVTVPIGEQITLGHIPNILYVNYNGPPYHGYITFTETEKKNLLVLNPRAGSSTTTGGSSVARGVPETIVINSATGIITNIPTDIQQEVLLKGGIRNVTTTDGGSLDEPLVFYISILVGGIDWKPASRFPSEVDLLDPADGYMKEPVTSADIPAVDAYQYLISLQVRSQAEDYQLESLKQSLAKKMILARDINYLMACMLAVERAYFELIEEIKRLRSRVDYIEGVWLPDLEGRLFTTEINVTNIWDNLILNWNKTHEGLWAARNDAYWRVYRALRHYGSHKDNGTAWTEIPIFGQSCTDGTGTSTTSHDIAPQSTGSYSYVRQLIDPTTGGDKTITIRPITSPHSDIYGAMRFTGDIRAHIFHGHTWNDSTDNRTSSGIAGVFVKECFHNIVIKNSTANDSGGAIITQDQIGFYAGITDRPNGNENEMICKIHGTTNSATLNLGNNNIAIELDSGNRRRIRLGRSDETAYSEFASIPGAYTFIGQKTNSYGNAGMIIQSGPEIGSTELSRTIIAGTRIHFANSETKRQYINTSVNTVDGQAYLCINLGNGGVSSTNPSGEVSDTFFIGKTGQHVIMEYENGGQGRSCGIAFKGVEGKDEGLHLFGLSKKTLDEIAKYVAAYIGCPDGASGGGPYDEIGPGILDRTIMSFSSGIPDDLFNKKERMYRTGNAPTTMF